MSLADTKPTIRRLETEAAGHTTHTNDSSSTLAETHRNSVDKKTNKNDQSQVNTARLDNPFAEKTEVSASPPLTPPPLGCLHSPARLRSSDGSCEPGRLAPLASVHRSGWDQWRVIHLRACRTVR